MKKNSRLYAALSIIIFGLCACANTNKESGTEMQVVETMTNSYDESTAEGEKASEESPAETQKSTYEFKLEPLDTILTIPEDMYAYEINGIYLDWTGEISIQQFSQWVVITDVEYDENVLAENLKTDYTKAVEHIVYVIAITPQELFPARMLCYSIFPVSDVRVSGNCYVELFNTKDTIVTDGWIGSYKRNESAVELQEWEFLRTEWDDCVSQSTIPTISFSAASGGYLQPDIFAEEPYKKTLVNNEWWDVYNLAVAVLSSEAYKYVYDEMVTESFIVQLETFAQDQKEYSEKHRTEALLNVYADSSQDIYLRAYYYACAVMSYFEQSENPLKEFSPENIVVVMQEWKNGQRSFNVYINQDSSWREYGSGYDYMADLTASYEYVEGRTN